LVEKRPRRVRRADPVVRAYGVGEVEKLTGISRITLHVWDRNAFVKPSLSAGGRGTGNRRKYSFADVVALRVIKRLRGEGVPIRALKKVAQYLKEREGVENPFAERVLAMSGSDVVMVSPEEVISVLEKPGQYLLLLNLNLEDEAAVLRAKIAESAA